MAIEPIENTELIAHSTPPLSMIKMSRQWFAENRQRLLKFAGVGITGVVVNLMIFELCFGFLLTGFFGGTVLFNVSNGLAILVSIFTNFLLNDLWTWGDRVKGVRKRDWLKRITKYYLSASL
ncbi:MAG: GtrA family protein, partial [Bradymonadaceae bacterium]